MARSLRTLARAQRARTGVGTVVALRGEAHGGTVAAAGVAELLEGAGSVPCQAHEHGAQAAVIVVLLALKDVGDGLADLRLAGGGVSGV